MREKYKTALQPQKKAAATSLVSALDRGARIPDDRSGGATCLLSDVKATIADLVAAPTRFRVDQPPADAEMVAMFDAIVAGQCTSLDAASPGELTAASRAYVGTATRRP
jgi:hypothetical protein